MVRRRRVQQEHDNGHFPALGGPSSRYRHGQTKTSCASKTPALPRPPSTTQRLQPPSARRAVPSAPPLPYATFALCREHPTSTVTSKSGDARRGPPPHPASSLRSARCLQSARCASRAPHLPLLAVQCGGKEMRSPRCGRVRGYAHCTAVPSPPCCSMRRQGDARSSMRESARMCAHAGVIPSLPFNAAAWRRTLLDAGECVDVMCRACLPHPTPWCSTRRPGDVLSSMRESAWMQGWISRPLLPPYLFQVLLLSPY